MKDSKRLLPRWFLSDTFAGVDFTRWLTQIPSPTGQLEAPQLIATARLSNVFIQVLTEHALEIYLILQNSVDPDDAQRRLLNLGLTHTTASLVTFTYRLAINLYDAQSPGVFQ